MGKTLCIVCFISFGWWAAASSQGLGFQHARYVQSISNDDDYQFPLISRYLILQVLSDRVIHFEVASTFGEPPDSKIPIYLTPHIDKLGWIAQPKGPTLFKRSPTGIETASLRLDVDSSSLCMNFFDKVMNATLTKICPKNLEAAWKGLELSRNQITDLYGLGENFLPHRVGQMDGNWMGEVRAPGTDEGNAMTGFYGGGTGNAQFPILYALGPGKLNYALFLDQVYRQEWDFRSDPFRVQTWGDQIRGFFIAGADLPDLRTSYMNLVGKPLIPPRKAFGLWISEYGFESWTEIDDKLKTLRSNKFPVDGFVMDLQWFGGVASGSPNSPMGTLRFDERAFPNSAVKINSYKVEQGIGIITIEESYVSRGLSEHRALESKGFLARENLINNQAFYINENPWWGLGGMIDWTNVAGGVMWHDWKRQPLIDLGIMGHWTDLGEPEMFRNKEKPSARPYYSGFPELGKYAQADVHNIYSLKWSESIADGYRRNKVERRPWILSRSGAPGIQRFGTVMWSGDIGSNFGSLATQFNVQMHMSLSGVDYFGSDVGGFHRGGLDREPGANLDELYTQWFAGSAALDVPLRPHTENLNNSRQTAPDRIGFMESNRANLRQRYELSPYYYSLAHRAYLYGEPITPPLVYYYQDAVTDSPDMGVRTMGHEKLIGRDLLVAVVARSGETQRDVYLPPGEWIDYYTHKRHLSKGETLRGIAEYNNGIFRLPMFVKAGALIPKMFVDEKTLNIVGFRSDGSTREELIVRAYVDSSGANHSFTVYEDDGRTIHYQHGAVATTEVRQQNKSGTIQVTVATTQGAYEGMPLSRNYIVEMVIPPGSCCSDRKIKMKTQMSFNGELLNRVSTQAELDLAVSGWRYDADRTMVIAKSKKVGGALAKVFTLKTGLLQ
jgi:alpha-glucosidase (family GH31 glycosyl hydrolase)